MAIDGDGPFLEVPYALNAIWFTAGLSWAAIVAADGLPAAVCARVFPKRLEWVQRSVTVWRSIEDYAAAHGGRRECPTGKAWIGPAEDGGIRFLTGVMDPPIRGGGARGRWRW